MPCGARQCAGRRFLRLAGMWRSSAASAPLAGVPARAQRHQRKAEEREQVGEEDRILEDMPGEVSQIGHHTNHPEHGIDAPPDKDREADQPDIQRAIGGFREVAVTAPGRSARTRR